MVQHEVNPSQLQCSICNFTTISKAQLNNHMALHKVSYSCEECNVQFKNEDALKFHLEEVHQNQYAFIDGNSSDPYSLVEIPTSY